MSLQKLSNSLAAFLALVCFPMVAVADGGGVDWRSNLNAAKIEAAQSNRLVLLHFYTKSCGPCRVLDKQVFSQPQVGAALDKDFVAFKVDADASPALRSAYGIERVPTEVVITPQGTLVAKLGSAPDPTEYVTRLSQVATQHRQSKPSESRDRSGKSQWNPAYANLDVKPSDRAIDSTQTIIPQSTVPSTSDKQTATPASVATVNPYIASAAPPVAQSNPAASTDRYAQQTTATPDTTQAQVPANAMPQSYRNPYVVATPAPAEQTKQSVEQAAPVVAAAAVQTTAPAKPTADSNLVAHAEVAQEQAITPAIDESVTPTPMKSGIVSTSPTQEKSGSAPLGFDGCCPVTLKTANKWVRGKPAIGLEHRGRIYLFAGEQERQQFFANPDAFSPVFSGLDPVLMLEQNASVPGSRKFGYQYRGAFYLFSSEATMKKFESNPDSYSASVRQAMTRIDSLNNGGVIRR